MNKKNKQDKIIVLSGSFNPLSLDDVLLISKARRQGDWIVIGVFSDEYVVEKLDEEIVFDHEARISRIQNLRGVDEVFRFDDKDGTSVDLLMKVQMVYPDAEIWFITEDEGTTTIPETKIKDIKFLNLGITKK